MSWWRVSELMLVSICPLHFYQLFRWKPDRQPGYLKEICSDKLYKCFCLCMLWGPSLYAYHSSPLVYPCYQPHSSSVSPPSRSQTCSPPTARPSSAAITASSPWPPSTWMSTATASSWEGKTCCILSCWDPPAVSLKRCVLLGFFSWYFRFGVNYVRWSKVTVHHLWFKWYMELRQARDFCPL